ncbi:MAG: type transport system ATP-binding protein [Thermomicrobiales bacterium]|nr:type transport system ATP-binding protein [Thermomicrobiales bacterium]
MTDGRHPPMAQQAQGGTAPILLRTIGLTKRFGAIVAVDGLDLEVRSGEVFGFLGPNGSGKSTTVGMILGLIRPTAGRIEFRGRDLAAQRTAATRAIGAIIETPAFYPFLSGRDNLRALSIAAGGVPERRIDELLELVGLTERAGSQYKTYSLGMKQRLGIASTLLTDPELVILDEPTNGLDPAGQREIRELIPMLARQGHGVLLASHLLNEVQQVCHRVAIIRRGRLIQTGTVAELVQRDAYLEVFLPAGDLERAAAVVQMLPFVGQVTVVDGRLRIVAPREQGATINRALAEAGLYASAIVPRESSLEDVFLELTEDDQPGERRDADVATAA